MRSPYAQPLQPVPDNVWLTFLIAAAAAFLVWVAGGDVAGVIQSEGPVNAIEQALLEGRGHPLCLWIERVSDEDPALLWNRVFSLVGWLLALGAMTRLLVKQAGMSGAIPSLVVLVCLPGFTGWMVARGLLGFAAWAFVRALRYVLLGEFRSDAVKGGVWLALAVILHPAWLVPAVGWFVGLWDTRRRGVVPAAIGFAVPAAFGVVLALLVGNVWAGSGVRAELPGGWFALMTTRHFFLLGAGILILAFGGMRRGVGWWCLVGTLPLPLLFLARGMLPSAGWVPLLVMTALGLAKLPVLIDLRHPRAYQSFLFCQLLLWMPAALDHQSDTPFTLSSEIEESADAP